MLCLHNRQSGKRLQKILFFLLFFCVFLLFSCKKQPELLATGPAEASTVQLGYIDRELARIAEDAQDTLPGFFKALARGAGAAHFCVKYPLPADEGSGIDREQVWLTGIHFKNGMHYGIIANAPRHLSGVKKGDKIIFDMDAVTDWMYIRDGKIIGGDSIKYLLEQIPEGQRGGRERELLRMLN
jgi:uncharacterized protein YegJ (DUF2314 family)